MRPKSAPVLAASILAAPALALFLTSAAAAEVPTLSQTADRSMWCATALARLEWKGAVNPDDRPRLNAAIDRHRDVVLAETQANAVDEAGLNLLIESYADEVIMQVDDYLVNRSKDALRIDIDTCY